MIDTRLPTPGDAVVLDGLSNRMWVIAGERANWAAALAWLQSEVRPYPYRGSLSELLISVEQHVETVSIRAGFIPAGLRIPRDGKARSRRERAMRLFDHWQRAGRPMLREGVTAAYNDLVYRVGVYGAVHGLISGNRCEGTRNG